MSVWIDSFDAVALRLVIRSESLIDILSFGLGLVAFPAAMVLSALMVGNWSFMSRIFLLYPGPPACL